MYLWIFPYYLFENTKLHEIIFKLFTSDVSGPDTYSHHQITFFDERLSWLQHLTSLPVKSASLGVKIPIFRLPVMSAFSVDKLLAVDLLQFIVT